MVLINTCYLPHGPVPSYCFGELDVSALFAAKTVIRLCRPHKWGKRKKSSGLRTSRCICSCARHPLEARMPACAVFLEGGGVIDEVCSTSSGHSEKSVRSHTASIRLQEACIVCVHGVKCYVHLHANAACYYIANSPSCNTMMQMFPSCSHEMCK